MGLNRRMAGERFSMGALTDALMDIVARMADEGYVGGNRARFTMECTDKTWTVHYDSIETTVSWYGCGRGSTLVQALDSMEDHDGQTCPCSRGQGSKYPTMPVFRCYCPLHVTKPNGCTFAATHILVTTNGNRYAMCEICKDVWGYEHQRKIVDVFTIAREDARWPN